MVITKNAIFNNKILIENAVIRLWYGYHSKLRLEERSKGSLQIKPNVVRITRKNVIKVFLNEKGKIDKFIMRLDYSRSDELYLVVTPSYHIENDYFVKSLWFKKKNKRCLLV